jgi:ATP-dependent DNA helicase PIF1
VLTSIGKRAAICAPTGVAATQLPHARTFHSTFGAFYKQLNASEKLSEMRESLGGDDLALIVIDELSMLDTKFLLLADRRLRSMYNNELPFGGISMLLAGDFLQVSVFCI